MTGLLHIHSLLRYILLALIIISVIKSFRGWFGEKQYLSGDKKIDLFTLISAHLQLVIGLILYFMSPTVKIGLSDLGSAMKHEELRFWSVEHISMMILAIGLITIGYAKAKRAATDKAKHILVAIFFLLALVVIFIAIPWPWSAVSRGWMPGM